MIIKVCGMRDPKNIRAVEALGIDMMGFIFYPKSPRFVKNIPNYLPQKAHRIGIFVNEDYNRITTISLHMSLDYIQLHGNETPEFCQTLQEQGHHIIKAFSIAQKEDIQQTKTYENKCDYFLFDTKCNGYGGSGNAFNWNILYDYQGDTPFILSGGINNQRITEIQKFKHPKLAGFDLNSGFESAPAIKNINLLKTFISQIK